MAWKKIEDEKVLNVWQPDVNCECATEYCAVHPDWYQDNGTPTCECGLDMVYSHTEILE